MAKKPFTGKQPDAPKQKAKEPAPEAEAQIAKPAYSVPALDKGLDILELMANLSEPVTPSQIAQRLGRSLQEVYRIVLSLERRGYILRPPGAEALVLSTELFGLATRFPPFRRVVDVAQPIINGLAMDSGEAVHIAVLDGLRMCIIAQVNSPQPIGVRLSVGAHSPAIRGASGRTLIAFQPPPVREWYLREAESTLSKIEMGDARQRVEDITHYGYELIEGTVLPGIVDISFPILGSDGTALAAVTIPYLSTYGRPIPLETVARMLHGAADQISAILGGSLAPISLPLRQLTKATD